MSLDHAIRLTEIILAVAFIQQSLEHLSGSRREKILFLPRLVLSVLLLIGFQALWVCVALLVSALVILRRFQGPYNGGSDLMGLLILVCLTLAHAVPAGPWQGYVFAYLALQLMLSYFKSGWVKVRNPDWRNGTALRDVFRFSAYPVSESLRAWADRPRLLCTMSWAVILFELAFPLVLVSESALILGLGLAIAFHVANACLFGFNRFLWVWPAAYPSLFWLQNRLMTVG
jgi:hypothetical protein